jgi:VanZ family protein
MSPASFARFKAWRVLLGAQILLVCFLTLRPAQGVDTTALAIENAAADFVRNFMLFFPLGASLALCGLDLRRCVLVSLAFCTGIEFCQGFIPGRFSDLLDIASNTLGASTGALLWHRRFAVRRAPGWVPAVAATAAAVCVTAIGVLMHPSLPTERRWRGDWTPQHAERYRGQILAATLGSRVLRPWRATAPEDLRRALATSIDLNIKMIVGPATPRRATLLNMYDEVDLDIMDLSVDGDDLVFRLRPRAADLLLDQPVVRWRRLFRGVTVGDTITLQIRRRGSAICATIRDAESCTGPRVRDGWMLVVSARSLSPKVATLVGWGFLAALALPVGLLSGSIVASALGGLVLALGMATMPPVVGLEALSVADWVAVALGVGAGAVLRRRPALRYGPERDPD